MDNEFNDASGFMPKMTYPPGDSVIMERETLDNMIALARTGLEMDTHNALCCALSATCQSLVKIARENVIGQCKVIQEPGL